ncbi:MAG TPA: hypothetical protein VJT81_06795 [Burkholderiales bacterium]|nr:hypothetical protein [Burkholderiales bacterium]
MSLSPDSPDHPDRIAANQTRYAQILQDNQPDSSEEIRAAFLAEMRGKEYGTSETLDAFGWFWTGWVAQWSRRNG